MRELFRQVLCLLFVTSTALTVQTSALRAASNCPDSTATLVPIFGWDIPADGWDIAVGTNGFVYVTDPVNNRICRYSLYGNDEVCWDSPDPFDPGRFVQPRWLEWNPVNSRIYVSGQVGPPTVPVFDASGTFLFDIKADSLSTEPGHFAGPTWAIAIDPVTGYVWVHEQNLLDDVWVDRIQEFDLNGNYTGQTFNLNPGCKLQAPLAQVWDIAVDSTGSVYLLEGGYQTGVVHCYVPGVGCVANWGDTPGPGALYDPVSIEVDKDGFINVLDLVPGGAMVYKYSRSGSYITAVQVSQPGEYSSLALDFMRDAADPFMLVAQFQPHRVKVFGTGIEPMNVLETTWVDPTSFQLKTDDLAFLAECETGPQDKRIPMKGVAADGVSPLLLRLRLPEPGTVQWKVTDPDQPGITENLGTLATLDSAQTGLVIEATVETVDDEHIAFAVYTAPIDFERPSVPADHAVGERPLRVTAEFMPGSGADTVVVVSDLTIERPTVLFLHGWLEDSSRWGRFKSIVTPSDSLLWGDERLIVADYSSTNGAPLAVNAERLQSMLTSFIASARDRRIASVQVDIVSHSMGGLVLRRLADATPQDPFKFRSTANMGQGYYHKAMFLNTPHQGSPLANITVTLRDIMNGTFQPPRRRLAARGMLMGYAAMVARSFRNAKVVFHQLINGAVDDMSLESDAVMNLETFTTPTHAHVGTGGSDLWFTPRLLKAAGQEAAVGYTALVTRFTNIPEVLLYYTSVHDVAVILDSQVGGLSNPGHYITATFEDGLHESSFFSSISGSRARDWATRSVSDASFFAPSLPGGSALAPETQRWMNNLTQAIEEEMPEFAGVTVRIVTPSSGFSKIPGDSFLVEVEPYSDVSTVIVTYPGGALFMDSTLVGYAHTDSAFNGPFELSALALMADGTLGRSESVTGIVRPPVFVPLTSIKVTPPSVSLSGVGSLLDLRVVGTYSDGVERDVSSAASGATYSGFDPGVISVSADGVIRGSGPGRTTATVQNGPFSQVVQVEVGDAPPINNQPHAMAGGPYQICNGEGVTLDASASFDFDGDALSYAWDLDGDGEFGDLVGTSVFYSPPYIVDERLIGLRVTDSGGAVSEDYTTIHVPLSCFAGDRICTNSPVAWEASDLGTDGTGDVYVFSKLTSSGNIIKRNGTCAFVQNSIAIYDPADLDELAVDSAGVAYVIGAPADAQILRFGPGILGELDFLIPLFTAPYSLVSGIGVDAQGNIYGGDYDGGGQDVVIRKFDAEPVANLLATWNLTLDAGIASAESLTVAIAPDSAIFVGVGNEVLKGIGQSGTYALDRRWGSYGLGAGQFRRVSDVAVGPDGDVYVADYGNHRIQRFASDGTFRSMRKGTDWPDGKFYHPTAVTVLDFDRVAVADFELDGDPRVQVFYWGEAAPTPILERPAGVRNALVQNYPNPFNPTTTIRFSLARDCHVVLTIYDVRGARVRTLLDEARVPGDHRVVWDGRSDAGLPVSSGIYFYKLTAGDFRETKKMVLLK